MHCAAMLQAKRVALEAVALAAALGRVPVVVAQALVAALVQETVAALVQETVAWSRRWRAGCERLSSACSGW
jgi:hypothetical protein